VTTSDVAPPQCPTERPGCPQSDAGASDGVLALWAREHCPHVEPDGKCRHLGGHCRLLGPVVRSCEWAEHDAALLAAPEPILAAYEAAVPGVWWRRRRAKPAGAAVAPVPAPEPKRAGRVCPSCGRAELARGQRLCDACRLARRRATWRQAQAKRRENRAGASTVGQEGATSPTGAAPCVGRL